MSFINIDGFDADGFTEAVPCPDPAAESVSDAIIHCINDLGAVDVMHIAALSGKTPDEVVEVFRRGNSLFQDPEKWCGSKYSGWVTADEYLSGNLYFKMKTAERALEKHGNSFEKNVAALKLHLPPKTAIGDIHVKLGSPWLTTDLVDEFIEHLFGKSYAFLYRIGKLRTVHELVTGTWYIPEKNRYGCLDVKSRLTYGTDRLSALYLIEKKLNNAPIEVYDYSETGKPTLNRNETIIANEHSKLLDEKFDEFINSSPARKYLVEQIYYERFCNVQRHFNGDFLEFPGLNPEITLYQHQRNAVARGILDGNMFLAHEVGNGKTYTLICLAMELHRMHISEKTMIVVPNAILGQWEDFFRLLYRSANILVVYPRNFTPAKRKATLEKMRDEAFDAIIVPYSIFDRLRMSKAAKTAEIEEQIRKIKSLITDINYARSSSLKRKLRNLEDRLQKIRSDSYNVGIYFDDLNINTLMVDEIHNYKNISLGTGFADHMLHGISAKGSAKNDAMLEKIHYVQKMNNGKGIFLASGTPVTNSLTDLYAIQKMIQSGSLALCGISGFNEWIGAFAERQTSFELDVDPANFRIATRFTFHNMPELAKLFSSVADFHNVDIGDLPGFDGYEDIIIPSTGGLIAFNHKLSTRVDNIHKGLVSRKEDNLLFVTIQARLAALDLRHIYPQSLFSENCKAAACARKAAEIYKQTSDFRGTQLIFCDTSTPKSGFNMYDETKRLLILYGVAEDEIAFVHDASTDAARAKLFEDTRNGRIRILIGSTKKLGTGTNVQTRLYAIHHLSTPWSPSEMDQREGRICRQGNINTKIHIFRYITSNSFDSYSYQILETKQKLISELLRGCITDRDGDDIEMVLEYGEIKALCTGNPNLKHRFEAENTLSKARALQSKKLSERQAIEQRLSTLPDLISEQYLNYLHCVSDVLQSSGEVFKDEAESRRVLNHAIAQAVVPGEYDDEAVICRDFHGFSIIRPKSVPEKSPFLFIEKSGRYSIDLTPSKGSAADASMRIINAIKGLKERRQKLEDQLNTLIRTESELKAELEAIPDYSAEIEELKERVAYYDRIIGAA